MVSPRAGDLAVAEIRSAGLVSTDFGKLARKYAADIERRSGIKLEAKQVQMLEIALRSRAFKKLGAAEKMAHTKQYSRAKKTLIADWEKHTGQKWPRYPKNMTTPDGRPHKLAGKKYQFHHIIPQELEGPHAWWNGHPLHMRQHQAGVHGKNAPLRELLKRKPS